MHLPLHTRSHASRRTSILVILLYAIGISSLFATVMAFLIALALVACALIGLL